MDQHSRWLRPLALYLLLAAVPACSESTGPRPVTLEALEGHWKATSLVYRALADPSQTVDLVATGEQTVDLTIYPGAAYARLDTFPTPRFAVAYDSGAVIVAAPRLEFASSFQDTLTSNASFDGTHLVLTDTVTMRLLCAAGCEVRYRFRRLRN